MLPRPLKRLLGVVVASACVTPGTLLMTAGAEGLEADGSEMTLSFVAIRSTGAQGQGRVSVISTAGSLVAGRVIALDVSGRAEVGFSCDGQVDPKCQGEVVVKGSWEGVQQEVRVQVRPKTPTGGGTAGGMAGGSAGGQGGCFAGLGGGGCRCRERVC